MIKCKFPGCKIRNNHRYEIHSPKGTLWFDEKTRTYFVQCKDDITDPRWIEPNGWISINDHLPSNHERILTYDKDMDIIDVSFYDEEQDRWLYGKSLEHEYYEVTH